MYCDLCAAVRLWKIRVKQVKLTLWSNFGIPSSGSDGTARHRWRTMDRHVARQGATPKMGCRNSGFVVDMERPCCTFVC